MPPKSKEKGKQTTEAATRAGAQPPQNQSESASQACSGSDDKPREDGDVEDIEPDPAEYEHIFTTEYHGKGETK